MGGVRCSHALALAASAALLLLLARLPPAYRAPTPLRLISVTDALTGRSDTTRRSSTLVLGPTTPPPASSASPALPVPAAAASAPTPAEPKPIMTRELYVSGHSRPHPELCPSLGARLQLLILVTSALSHAQARSAVRLTWGHYAVRSDVALAFVLGSPPKALDVALEVEDQLYGDLVIGNFVDAYSNLTLKTLSMLEWADTYCPRAPRLLKTDDDMFINVPKLLAFATTPARANTTSTIWGKVLKKSLPIRIVKSKYFLSPLQYPGKVLPDFATGPAYLVSGDCIRAILQAAGNERYVRLEDVFVTGLLANRLNIRRLHVPAFYNKWVVRHPCTVQRGIAIHMVRFHEQFDLWCKLLDGKTNCASIACLAHPHLGQVLATISILLSLNIG